MLIDIGGGGNPSIGNVAAGVDSNGNHWNAVDAFETAVNLIDTTGASTAATLQISASTSASSNFTATPILTTIPAAPFDIPAACDDALYDNTATDSASRTFVFAGLNSTSTYRLTILSDRDARWAPGSITFTTGTGTDATLAQGLNVLTIAPSGAGDLVFSFDKSSGEAGWTAVINAISLEEAANETSGGATSDTEQQPEADAATTEAATKTST